MNIIENADVIFHRKLSDITQSDYIIRFEYICRQHAFYEEDCLSINYGLFDSNTNNPLYETKGNSQLYLHTFMKEIKLALKLDSFDFPEKVMDKLDRNNRYLSAFKTIYSIINTLDLEDFGFEYKRKKFIIEHCVI